MDYKICKSPGCSFNGEPQPIDHFCKDRRTKDGYHPYCRSCRAEITRARLITNPDAKARALEASRRYQKTAYGKKKYHDYYMAHKSLYRESERKRNRRPEVKKQRAAKAAAYREHNKLKECARHAAKYALARGILVKPQFCQWCGNPAKPEELEIHHWQGYEPQFFLSVKFVHSDPCHTLCEGKSVSEWPTL